MSLGVTGGFWGGCTEQLLPKMGKRRKGHSGTQFGRWEECQMWAREWTPGGILGFVGGAGGCGGRAACVSSAEEWEGPIWTSLDWATCCCQAGRDFLPCSYSTGVSLAHLVPPWGSLMHLNIRRTVRSWLPPGFPAGFVPWNLHSPVRCWW